MTGGTLVRSELAEGPEASIGLCCSQLSAPEIVGRRESICAASANAADGNEVHAQMVDLLAGPDAPVFDLVDRHKLGAAYAADPALTGTMGAPPSQLAPAAFLVDVNEWLSEYSVHLV